MSPIAPANRADAAIIHSLTLPGSYFCPDFRRTNVCQLVRPDPFEETTHEAASARLLGIGALTLPTTTSSRNRPAILPPPLLPPFRPSQDYRRRGGKSRSHTPPHFDPPGSTLQHLPIVPQAVAVYLAPSRHGTEPHGVGRVERWRGSGSDDVDVSIAFLKFRIVNVPRYGCKPSLSVGLKVLAWVAPAAEGLVRTVEGRSEPRSSVRRYPLVAGRLFGGNRIPTPSCEPHLPR